MAAETPWSVKGIDPESREIAKQAARRAGLTLGVWLCRTIRETAKHVGDETDATAPRPQTEAATLPDGLGVLSQRIDAQEARLAESLGPLAERVETLSSALETLRRSGEITVPEAVGALLPVSQRLDVLTRKVDEQRERSRMLETGTAEAIGPLLDKIEEFARILNDLRNDREATRLSARVAALENRLEESSESEPDEEFAPSPAMERAVVRLVERVQQIEQALEEPKRRGVFGLR